MVSQAIAEGRRPGDQLLRGAEVRRGAVASVASVLAWHRYVKDVPVAGGVMLNKRGMEHVGTVVALEEAIVGGSGRVRIDDTLWNVLGAGCACRQSRTHRGDGWQRVSRRTRPLIPLHQRHAARTGGVLVAPSASTVPAAVTGRQPTRRQRNDHRTGARTG
jgi:hypothetical protein